MRLFVAVLFIPAVKRGLVCAINTLRKSSVSGNFTREENLHLTLAFIGETDEIESAKEAIRKTEAPAFDIRFGGFGHFGDIYWAGIDRNRELEALAEAVQKNLRAHGFSIEKRKFTPHITLARRLVSRSEVKINTPELAMRVQRVSLMKSERINGRLTYTEIFGKELE